MEGICSICLSGGIEDGSLLGGNSTASDTLFINFEGETETDKGSDDLAARAVNFPEQIEDIENVKESRVLPDLQETSLFSQDVDDSDGSDIVEHDVSIHTSVVFSSSFPA